MKIDWTRKRTKIETWQNSSASALKRFDLNLIKLNYQQERVRLEAMLEEITGEKMVFWDDEAASEVGDMLLTIEQWHMVCNVVS
jgi:hypothetical protein